jgi:hypothetical protein
MSRSSCLLVLALLVACQTENPYQSKVDPALLEYVNENGRNRIAEARRHRDEAADAVAAAQRRADQSRRELEVEQASRRVEEAKLEKANTEQRVDRQAAGVEGDGNRAGDGTSVRDAGVHDARAGVQVVDDRIAWRKECITAADREVDLAKAKLELARARVALAEAEALRDTDRPEADRIDMVAIQRDLRARETEVDVAKVRLEAAQRECDLAKRRVDETPAQREERMRRLERRPDAPPVSPTDPREGR